MEIRKVVIPAAGLGTRLYPLTRAQPKEMLPLGRKPTIQWVAEEAVANGLDEILIITGRQKRAVEDHLDFDSGEENGSGVPPEGLDVLHNSSVRFFFTRQSVPRGLGDAVAQARLFTGPEPFAVALGDAVIMRDGHPASLLGRMTDLFLSRQVDGVVAVREVPRELVSSYGVVQPAGEPGETFLLADLVEKPAPEQAPSRLAVTARYVFAPCLHDYLERTAPDAQGEVQLTDAVRAMIADGRQVWAVRLAPGEVRYDVGNFLQYARAFCAVALADPEVGEELSEYLRSLL